MVENLADDVGQDPTSPRYPGLGRQHGHAVAAYQMYWRSLGTWTGVSWRLPWVVVADGDVVGVQDLEAEDFTTRGEIDSSSHLRPDVRGRGWGQQSRRAILALAFGPLGARTAVTSAWHHNLASLGVTRALGYRFSHTSQERTDDQSDVDTMHHYELTREDWDRTGQASTVQITGFAGCQPFFDRPGT